MPPLSLPGDTEAGFGDLRAPGPIEELRRRVSIARGEGEADLLLANARVLNVFSGEILTTNVAVAGKFIAGVGPHLRRGRAVLDLHGAGVVLPGLIDAHIHIESSHLSAKEFARAVAPHGTTAVVVDPHEIANVLGLEGVRYVLRTSRDLPIDVFVMASSCVPATSMETSGAVLGPAEIAEALDLERVIGLAEVMNFPDVVRGEPEVLSKISVAAGRPVDGHAPGVGGADLVAYAAAGITSDHESTTLEEAREKLRLGMWVFIREGSAAKNLEAILPLISDSGAGRFCFACDDRSASDLVNEGHMDAILRKAVALGLDPIQAVRLATIQPALRFGLDRRGAVAPGFLADIVVVRDLVDFRVERVIKSGRIVVENGRLVETRDRSDAAITDGTRESVHVAPLPERPFRIPARGAQALVIGIVPDQIVTRRLRLPVAVRNGEVVPDAAADVSKVAVIERHQASGRIGLGLVKGFGIRGGALASTFAHDSHNLIVIGDGDDDMRLAAERAVTIGGGFVVAADGVVRAEMPLPIAGVMSDRPVEEVVRAHATLDEACRALSVKPRVPFLTLAFLALPVIPELKITDRGLVDVTRFRLVDLFSDGA